MSEIDTSKLPVPLKDDDKTMNLYTDEKGEVQLDRRKADKVLIRINTLEDNQEAFRKEQCDMKEQLDNNTVITKKINKDVETIIELLDGTRAVIKIVVLITRFGRWFLGAALTVYGLYLLFRGKISPSDIHLDPFD